jgi:hypothetical protein
MNRNRKGMMEQYESSRMNRKKKEEEMKKKGRRTMEIGSDLGFLIPNF